MGADLSARLDLFPLSETWVPPKLEVRDVQFSKLVEAAVRALETGFGTDFWIHGGPGLGKTLTALFFKRYVEGTDFGREVKVLYHAFSGPRIEEEIGKLCVSLDYRKAWREYPAEALAKAVDSFLRREKGDGGGKAHVVMIFDDVDKAKNVWRTEFSNFLHDLTDRLTARRQPFSIHLISTVSNLAAKHAFSEAAWSRLQPMPLSFPPYSKEEVALLLRQRLELIDGLEWDEGAVEWVAEEVAGFGGDFRKALRLVKEAIVGTGKFTYDEAVDVLIQFMAEVHADAIRALGYERALLLRALVEVLWERSDRLAERFRDVDEWDRRVEEMERSGALVAAWDDVIDRYYGICEELGIAPRTDDVLYKWLRDELDPFGVERLKLRSKDPLNYKRKYGTFLRLRVPFRMVSRAVRLIDWRQPW